VKLKEETEEGGEVCRLLSSWGCPRPHSGGGKDRILILNCSTCKIMYSSPLHKNY
jgi:hypothetical protein